MLTNTSKNQDTSFSPERILQDGELFEEEEYSLLKSFIHQDMLQIIYALF